MFEFESYYHDPGPDSGPVWKSLIAAAAALAVTASVIAACEPETPTSTALAASQPQPRASARYLTVNVVDADIAYREASNRHDPTIPPPHDRQIRRSMR